MAAKKFVLIELCTAIMIFGSSYAMAGTWTTIDMPGGWETHACGISGKNVVGWYIGSGWISHGFLYDGTTWTTLDAPGSLNTCAFGVSGNNIVGGYDGFGYADGFLYDGTNWTTLDMPGADLRWANGISGNNIVGVYCDSVFGNYHSFFYDGSTWVTLNFPGADETWANGISGNNIVGSYVVSGKFHGFLYNGTSWTTIDMPGASGTEAYGISRGNIVGCYFDGYGAHGFLYDGTTWTTLDMPGVYGTYVYGIEGSNIVGYSNGHGFIYTIPEPAKYSGGKGDPNDPYQIANVADFNQLTLDPNNWNKAFILTADINLAGLTFTQAPIAPDIQGMAFSGVFDGNDHAIFNLNITTSIQNYIGLFGYVGSGGQIRNLSVEDVNITGQYYVGGLVGVNSGSLTTCHATGSVNGAYYVGGLVGTNEFEGTITSCYATGSVAGNSAIGGLAGNNHGMLTYSYVASSVSGTKFVGGLVGYNDWGVVTSCYATGSVIGTREDIWNIGGLVGRNAGRIISCYAASSVIGEDLTGTLFLGGLVGYNGYLWSFVDSFWDINTSGRTTSAVGTGKTTSEMKMLSTFTSAGWDFITPVWIINEGIDYPHLWWENTAPVADAGPDQTVYAWIDGIADVNLDGSGSYDEDNDPLTYKWTWTIDGNDYEANEVNPSIELPVGRHTIQLIVNDGTADSEPNEVNITVIGPVEVNLCVMPRVLNFKSNQPKIVVMVRLPQNITRDRVDANEPILLYPGEIEADWKWIGQSFDYKCNTRSTTILATFDKNELMDAVDAYGPVELWVVGQLETGQYFFGTDTINVICPGKWPWHHRPWYDNRWNRWCHKRCNSWN
jgi:hypothetical protein